MLLAHLPSSSQRNATKPPIWQSWCATVLCSYLIQVPPGSLHLLLGIPPGSGLPVLHLLGVLLDLADQLTIPLNPTRKVRTSLSIYTIFSLCVISWIDNYCGFRTTPHGDKSPPNQNKAQVLFTRTTVPQGRRSIFRIGGGGGGGARVKENFKYFGACWRALRKIKYCVCLVVFLC